MLSWSTFPGRIPNEKWPGHLWRTPIWQHLAETFLFSHPSLAQSFSPSSFTLSWNRCMENTARISTVTATRSKTVLLATKASKRKPRGKRQSYNQGAEHFPPGVNPNGQVLVASTHSIQLHVTGQQIKRVCLEFTEHILNFFHCFFFGTKLNYLGIY